MPTIRRRVAATTDDALTSLKFKILPPRGGVINLWAAGVTATDDIGYSVGSTEIISQNMDVNIEVSADVIDQDRDQVLFNELITPGGEQFIPVTVTTEMQFLLSMKYL